LAELVEELLLANKEHKLGALEKRWLKFELINIDELGYMLLFTKIGSELLFQFFAGRYESSVMITTNLEFTE
jgi:DNA replication protein DnaC